MKRKKYVKRDKELSFKAMKKLRITLERLGLPSPGFESNGELARYNKKYGLRERTHRTREISNV